MKTTFLQEKVFQPMGNSIQISDSLAVEWKAQADALATADEIEINGKPAVRIKTANAKGWVRLHLALPASEDPILATRFVLKVDKDIPAISVKPFPVETNLHSGSRSEFRALTSAYRRLKTGQWYDVAGAFLCGKVKGGRRIDMVMDLPLDAEIILADVSVDHFVATLGKGKAAALDGTTIETLYDFTAREIADLDSWMATAPVYGSEAELEGVKLMGCALTRAQTVYVAETLDKPMREVPLSQTAQASGVEIPDCGFDLVLDGELSQFSSLVMLQDKAAAQPFWTGAPRKMPMMEDPKKSDTPREKQADTILLWAPISTAGLTVQLEQVTKLLDKLKFPYKISYHMKPRVDHPLRKHWIEPRDIEQPKVVIYFERFVQFDRGFEGALKVFYMNLDWLAPHTLSLAQVHAKIVLCPTPYRLEELQETFSNSQVVHLPWPSKFEPRESEVKTNRDEPIRVLYVGNDYDDVSRKHPFAVVEAIERLERTDILFDLKFRTPLPQAVRERLLQNPRVASVVDWSTDHSVVEDMYKHADINLIPNACEGNGLSILEAWSSGTVPAVLDGHPMKDVTSPENSYRIACEEDGTKEYAPFYRTTGNDILAFLNGLDWDEVMAKKATVRDMIPQLKQRETDLEKTIESIALLGGIRTKGLRMRTQNAHLPSKKYKDWKPRSGARVKDLLFKDEGQTTLMRRPQHVDVLLTTSRRPWCLRESLGQLLKAMRLSPFQHRLFVAIDTLDPGTLAIINQHSAEIDQVLWTKDQHGLPYTWNSLKDLLRNTINRSAIKPDYVCYIQDDCYINDPGTYFEKMAGIAYETMPGYVGFVSGYYTEVHPGWAEFDWKGTQVIASDSIDGKNFMAPPELMESTGPLTWWFKDGMRRGNPGPIRGSHFDLWQWKESPNALTTQTRISLVLPELCSHIAAKAEDSTWNNDTTDEAVQKRIDADRVYQTRSYDS
jgi:hypothetical protein